MYIVGIDEVGRGALAGPVVVAAVALNLRTSQVLRTCDVPKLKDSKKLSLKQREDWLNYIKSCPRIFYAVSRVYPKKIDLINITAAANLAATRAFNRLTQNSRLRRSFGGRAKLKTSTKRGSSSEGKNCKIFLDGGLYLANSKISSRGGSSLGGKNQKSKIQFKIKNSKTIIKGDEKINAIKLASIVAKVTRDRYMIKLHESYPRYGFDIHKGYGTKFHIKAIRKHGYSDVHRRSFRIK